MRESKSPSEIFRTVAEQAAAEVHPAARGAYLDAHHERDKHRQVTFFPRGSLIKVGGVPGWKMYEDAAQGIRGRVSYFSQRAAARMMAICNMLDRDELPVFVTLTYPHELWRDPHQAKRDLDSWGKRLRYHYPEASAIWKLEPQANGSPHFHLLVFGRDFLPWQEVAVTWVEVVHRITLPRNWPPTGDAFHGWVDRLHEQGWLTDLQRRHLHAGTRVEKIRSRNGVMSYAGKCYMGKGVIGPDLSDAPRPLTREQAAWEDPGRFWGIIGRDKLPIAEQRVMKETQETGKRFARLVRRWGERKGLKVPTNGAAIRIYTNQQVQWARALAWAAGDWVQPLQIYTEWDPLKKCLVPMPPEKEWMGASLVTAPF